MPKLVYVKRCRPQADRYTKRLPRKERQYQEFLRKEIELNPLDLLQA